MASDPISITIDTSEIDQRLLAMLDKMEDPTPALNEIGLYMVRSIKRNFTEGGRPNKWQGTHRGGKILRDKGAAGLFGSIAYELDKKSVSIGTNVKYAPIQHFGGTISPKTAKALPVPLNDKARKAQQKVSSVRDIKGLVFIPSNESGLIGILGKKTTADRASSKAVFGTVTKTTKTGKTSSKSYLFEPWFALRTRVTIPARPFLMFQKKDYTEINKILKRHLFPKGK